MRGFVLVDKREGPTSHDIVDQVRGALGVKRVGHAGTLDPMASGLLVIGVGPATRLLSYVQRLPKVYETTGRLGVRTTTLDAAGDVVSQSAVDIGADEVVSAAAEFVGEIEQIPPAHSAVKVGGERAYRRARKGERVEIAARRVTVHSFEITRVARDEFDARIECSSGTYVRTLVADLGDRLGCGAHIVALRRTSVGHLRVTDAVPPDRVDEASLLPVEDALAHLPRIDVDEEAAVRAGHGRPIETDRPSFDEVLVCGPDGAIGVFRSAGGVLRPVTVLGR